MLGGIGLKNNNNKKNPNRYLKLFLCMWKDIVAGYFDTGFSPGRQSISISAN